MCHFFFSKIRAYADAGPSVRHSEQPAGDKADFVNDTDTEADSEKSVESCSGDEDSRDDGKKKKPRSGFRDRKVINKQ